MPLWKLWDPAPYSKGPIRSHPPVQWVISRQTSILVVETTGDYEPPLAPLGCGMGVPAKH